MVKKIAITIRKTIAGLALMSIELLIVLALFFIAWGVFIFLTSKIFLFNENSIDFKIFEFLAPHVTNLYTKIMQFFTILGTHYFLIPANIVLLLYFLLIKKHRWYSIKIPAIALSTTAMLFLLKYVFNRPRPLTPLLQQAKGLSFPSGHAMISLTFYGLLIYIVWQSNSEKWVKWILTFLLLMVILLIGFSRVYLRVHYASDVIAGFCAGLIWLVISIWVLRKMEKFSRRKVDVMVEPNITAIET